MHSYYEDYILFSSMLSDQSLKEMINYLETFIPQWLKLEGSCGVC